MAKDNEKAAKAAEKAARQAAGEDDDDDLYDEDAVLDPRDKAKLNKERELKSDLNNAADLLGAAALGGASHFSPTSLQPSHVTRPRHFVLRP